METFLAVSGALGGLAAMTSLVVVVVRGISGQAAATRANTEAMERLTSSVDGLVTKYDGHETRISHLEGWRASIPLSRRDS